jgi:hypothetical protein
MDQKEDLNIPLEPSRRLSFEIKYFVACAVLAWFASGRPDNIKDILISCILGGGLLWFLLSSAFWRRFEWHKNYLLYLVGGFLRIAGIIFSLKVLVPYVSKLI